MSSAPSLPSADPRLGSELPRVWTRPLRELTPETTLGYSVIEFAEAVVGLTLYPWQKWLLLHALELLPDGSFRFRTVVVLVARQNGKSTLSQLLALYCLYVLGVKLVIGTAQDLDLAEEIWDGVVEIIEDTEELAPLLGKVVKVNGKKALELTSGERYKVKAANRRAGRGLSGDLILLDELREHQHWAAWSALTKTTMARPNAQIWCLSNAGDITAVVLRHLRLQAHNTLGDPDGIVAAAKRGGVVLADASAAAGYEDIADSMLGFFEWSAEPDCSIWDRDGWAAANPSLGHGGLTERTVAAAAAIDLEWEFRTEVLCQWSDGVVRGVFPANTWEMARDPDSTPAPDARRVFAVDVSSDGTWSAIASCAPRGDDLVHGQVIEHHPGTGWVADRVAELVQRWGQHGPVVLCGRGAAAFKDELVTREVNGEPIECTVMSTAQQIAACLEITASVAGTPAHVNDAGEDVPARPADLRHPGQAALTDAVNGASKKSTPDGWHWERRGRTDISPLIALTGARWALARIPDDDYDVLMSAF